MIQVPEVFLDDADPKQCLAVSHGWLLLYEKHYPILPLLHITQSYI